MKRVVLVFVLVAMTAILLTSSASAEPNFWGKSIASWQKVATNHGLPAPTIVELQNKQFISNMMLQVKTNLDTAAKCKVAGDKKDKYPYDYNGVIDGFLQAYVNYYSGKPGMIMPKVR